MNGDRQTFTNTKLPPCMYNAILLPVAAAPSLRQPSQHQMTKAVSPNACSSELIGIKTCLFGISGNNALHSSLGFCCSSPQNANRTCKQTGLSLGTLWKYQVWKYQVQCEGSIRCNALNTICVESLHVLPTAVMHGRRQTRKSP